MKNQLLFLGMIVFMVVFSSSEVEAQCSPVDCSASLPAYGGVCDTVLATGTVNQAYNDFESFVITSSCFDAGLIDPSQSGTNIRITNVDNFAFSGLPAGTSGSTNQASYSPPGGGYITGCAAISGTPSEAGVFDCRLDFLADVLLCIFPIAQNDNAANYVLQMIVLPDASFSGLGGTYCATDGAISLTPTGTTGGTFSGPGVSGNSFNPSVAGPGTHTITYTVSAQQGSAVAPATDSSSQTVTVTDITLSTSSNNATCNDSDGSATVSASGGSMPYVYNWSSGANQATASNLSAGVFTVTVTDNNACFNTETVTVSSVNTSISATTSTVDAGCGLSNGSATVNPSNGTSPYSYIWAGGSNSSTNNGLSAGIYSVTITDAIGCTGTTSATVNNPNPPSATGNIGSNVSCFGLSDGNASVSASGGTVPYSYIWSNSQTNSTISGLIAGVYNVTVTDGASCSSSASITITEPSVLNAAVSSTLDNDCNGDLNGAVFTNYSGGTLPYSYVWTNGETSDAIVYLSGGYYEVTVTDVNGCTDTTGAIIIEPAALSGTINAIDVNCNAGSDGQLSANISGGTTPYSYLWSDNQTGLNAIGLSAGNYGLTVTDANNCALANLSQTLSEPTAIINTFNSTDPSTQGANDGSIVANTSGGVAPYSYSWNTGQNTASINNLVSGIYELTITDSNGCIFIDSLFLMDGPTAMIDLEDGIEFKVYPNPVRDVLNVHFSSVIENNGTLIIMNMLGERLIERDVEHSKSLLELNSSEWPTGVYWLQLEINKTKYIRRVIKN